MATSTQIERLRRELADEKGNTVRRALSTPDGKFLLQVLEKAFVEGELLGETDRETFFNLGAREVVVYLRSLVKLSEHVEKTGR